MSTTCNCIAKIKRQNPASPPEKYDGLLYVQKSIQFFTPLTAVLAPEAHCLNFANSAFFTAGGRYHIFGHDPFWLSGKR